MNTHELERLLRRHVRVFDGVFSCYRLPSRPRLFVANTDSSSKPDEHWIAIYVADDGSYGEYFDWFGRGPDRLFERYMNEHCGEWVLIIHSYKVPSVGSVDIIVRVSVFFVVETLVCLVL